MAISVYTKRCVEAGSSKPKEDGEVLKVLAQSAKRGKGVSFSVLFSKLYPADWCTRENALARNLGRRLEALKRHGLAYFDRAAGGWCVCR